MDELTPAQPQLPEGYEGVEQFMTEARERFDDGVNADGDNRRAAEDDLMFLTGEGQWDPQVKGARLAKGRPCLTINTLPQYVGQVIGDMRTNRPSIKVRPAEDADKDVAEIRQGLIRYIENQSDGLNVYALAGEDQVACGVGHFRVGLEYCDDKTFNQDIRIRHVPNPLNVVWDPLSVDATGKDARFCFVVDVWDKKTFEKAYPDAQTSELTVPQTTNSGWFTTDTVRVTEYWVMKEAKRTIALLKHPKTGEQAIADITGREDDAKAYMVPGKTRQVTKRTACMYLISGREVLDGPYEYPLDRIPIFKVTGREIRVGEKRFRFGLVRFAKDPIRMKNLWRSSAAEWLAQAPKQQWLLNAADEQEANRYRNAGKSGDTVLVYSGQIAPQRIDPPSAPAALLQEAQFNDQDIKDVTGLHDASLGMQSNETSGKAIMARERQGDVATFMYHDNLNASIRECGRVINELLPVVYDTARTITVLGEDEVAKSVRINDPTHPDGHLELGDGKYDVVVETGPSYSTKRVEAAESMMQFVQAVPAAAQFCGDLIAQAQDWPLADKIAERMRKALPPGIADDPNDNSPEAQQQRQQAQQAQQQQQQLQAQHAQLTLAEQQAKVDKLQAEADRAKADANAKGQGVDQMDRDLKAAQVRKAEAEADAAQAQAGIAFAQLAQLTNPVAAEAQAIETIARAHQAATSAASDAMDLEHKPKMQAVDLQRAQAEAEPDASDPNETAEQEPAGQ